MLILFLTTISSANLRTLSQWGAVGALVGGGVSVSTSYDQTIILRIRRNTCPRSIRDP